ncbi:hypothetical protein H072_10795 [Dactylellina haptotyla CBS 200.50]|uniref:Zn(2)-C6 fungal-type domain-containing protein n=1 Tax=Dactylellina haptotyla (strain CBS 200.50) TaxID=1284197 RepID=S8B9S7_DACHA|nr:hypothetical protein H072_10795 [Dactylellina haptotyla CBS 200.50]
MADLGSNVTDIGEKAEVNGPKRRKIRKGTQSCWECKRRKVRCTFASPTEGICDGCRSRGTKCIGQEFLDETAPTRRLNRVDWMAALVEQLAERSTGTQSKSQASERTPEQISTILSEATDVQSECYVTGDFKNISKVLLDVWPSQHNFDILSSAPVSPSVLYHGVVCIPYSSFLAEPIPSPQSLLQLPRRVSHPVIIARKLLLLATFLQGVPAQYAENLANMTVNYRTLMTNAVGTVGRLVTNNDELLASLESIECLMIESMYRNNAGDLRRAWLINRKAMTIAQLLGIHKASVHISPSMIIEEETRTRIDSAQMWFRIVCSDRYLSLMLGLPQGSTDNIFASLSALDTCTPLERMERLESLAGGMILQRNSSEQPDIDATRKIDKLLQDAGSLMSPKWWLPAPDPGLINGKDAKSFEETIRVTNQFTHYHQLVQLHLPYMMRSDLRYEYNKLTAANASRAILTGFLHFRNSVQSTAYCRGIDYTVFIASTVLCIAHIESRRGNGGITNNINVPISESLLHQRQSDRGLLDRTLEIMQSTAEAENDLIAKEISTILEQLLVIESDSTNNGREYQTTAELGADTRADPAAASSEVTSVLQIHIPHFGTIRIEERHAVPDRCQQAQGADDDWLHTVFTLDETPPPSSHRLDAPHTGQSAGSGWSYDAESLCESGRDGLYTHLNLDLQAPSVLEMDFLDNLSQLQ